MSHPSDKMEPVEVPLLLKQETSVLFGLTGRQVLILVCGVAISFSLWQSVPLFQSLFGVILLVCFCIVPAVVIAFAKIGTRPLDQWLFIVLAWMLTPERLSLKLLLSTFVKVRSINGEIVGLDLGGKQHEYQAILCIEPKDFNLLSHYEQSIIIESFGKMLNGLSYPVTIQVRSLPYRPTVLSSTVVPTHLARPLRHVHAHYLSFLSQLVREKRPVRVSYYITVPAAKNQSFEQAKGQIKNRVHELSHQLAQADLFSRSLSSTELFMFYSQSFLSQTQEHMAFVPDDVLSDAGQLPALLAPNEVFIAASYLDVQGWRGSHYLLECLALERLPRKLQPAWLHQVINMNEPYVDIILHIRPHESDIVAAQLRRRAVRLGGKLLAEKQQRGESGGGNTITRYALKDVERVREQLIRRDTHACSVTVLFALRGISREELNKRVSRVQLALRSLDFQTASLRFQQHLGYFSFLGYGQNMLPYYGHLLTTDAAASFYPFSHVPVMDKGVLLGISNGNLVSFDPYEEEKLNANLAVLGVPGSGKSSFLKFMLSRLALTTSISVIDIEDEYHLFIEAVGGVSVKLTAESLLINPFEMYKDKQQHSFREKVTALIGFFALLIGENGVLTQHDNAIIYRAIISTYVAAGITADPATHTKSAPNVRDFATFLKKETSTDLSLRLEPYIHLFPGQTRIPYDQQHAVYSLKELPEALRPAATYLITEKLWNELRESQQTRRLVVIDEAWFLSKFDAGAKLLNEFARRIRKYGGGLWLGTQQLVDLLLSEEAKNLLALCETKMLFRQDVSSIDLIRDILHLSETQVSYLRTARRGEALYITSKETLAVEVLASEHEIKMTVTTQGRGQKV